MTSTIKNNIILFMSIVFLSLLNIVCSFAQNSIDLNDQTKNLMPLQYYPNYEADYVGAMPQIFGILTTVWAYDKYIYKQDWANISLHSMEKNLKTGFVWDSNSFETNLFYHPYNGAFFFTAARASGVEFWKAVYYPIVGSLLWELFMETEKPSSNDLISTPLNGITLGEISFRLSSLLLDERSDGWERLFREFGATVLNPMHGFNRLVRGYAWRNANNFQKPPYSLSVQLGVNGFFEDRAFNNRERFYFGRFNSVYGHRFDHRTNKKPFDYFEAYLTFLSSNKYNVFEVFSNAELANKSIRKNLDIGFYKSFTYLMNDVYKISSCSAGGGLNWQFYPVKELKFENLTTLNFIFMGGINSIYATSLGRDYNLGPGLQLYCDNDLLVGEYFDFRFQTRGYYIKPVSGAQGNEFVILMNGGMLVKLISQTALGVEFLNYHRISDYDKYKPIKKKNTAIRVFFQFTLL